MIGEIPGLHIETRVNDICQDFFWRMVENREEIRPDLLADAVPAVTSDAAGVEDLGAARGIALQQQGRGKMGDGFPAGGFAGEHRSRKAADFCRGMPGKAGPLGGIGGEGRINPDLFQEGEGPGFAGKQHFQSRTAGNWSQGW